MKKILIILSAVITSTLTAQVTVEDATYPNFNDGKIIIDTTGTGIESWAIWKIEDGVRTDVCFGYNTKINSGLAIGSYWILGKKPNDGYSYSLDRQVNLGMRSSTTCDSMKLSNYVRFPEPILPGDPNPPQPGLVNMKFNYDIEKSCGPVNIEYYQQYASYAPQLIPSNLFYNNIQYNVLMRMGFFIVVTDCNCTAVISDMRFTTSATNYPLVGVPSSGGTNNTTAGLEKNSLDNFNIYPNPTNDLINIHRNNPTNEMITLEIKDLNGKTIFKNQGLNDSVSLKSIADSGIYFVTILDQNQEIIYKSKVILN